MTATFNAAAPEPIPVGNGQDVTAEVVQDLTEMHRLFLRGVSPCRNVEDNIYNNLIACAVCIGLMLYKKSGDTQQIISMVARVCKDRQDRSEMGFKKYGTVLKTDNGRNALMDLYQELLDAMCYAKQAELEGKL